MADERSMGVVLRTRPLTETSLIVQWLTPHLGRVSTVAKGARRPKSAFRGKLDLFYEADFSFQRSRRSDLHALREVSLLATHPGLRQDIDRLAQISYLASLVEQATEVETPLPEFYALFVSVLTELESHPPRLTTVFAFEWRLVGLLGLSPDLDAIALDEGSRQVLMRLGSLDWSTILRMQLSPAQGMQIQRFLRRLMSSHLDRIPSGRERALNCEGID